MTDRNPHHLRIENCNVAEGNTIHYVFLSVFDCAAGSKRHMHMEAAARRPGIARDRPRLIAPRAPSSRRRTHDPGRPRVLIAWQLPPHQLQPSSARPRRVLPIQPSADTCSATTASGPHMLPCVRRPCLTGCASYLEVGSSRDFLCAWQKPCPPSSPEQRGTSRDESLHCGTTRIEFNISLDNIGSATAV